MIQRLNGDYIWLQEGTMSELQHYIRRNLCIAGTAVKTTFLECIV